MRVGLLGTGAIANKHAQAYRNIGFELVACSNKTEVRGREFAARWGAQFIADYRELCRYPGLDFIDVCTFPDSHLEPVEICAEIGRPIQVQKPIATNLQTARRMIELAHKARVPLNVVSQHRFDDATIFLKRALAAGRLGRILQADAYVKWYRTDEYYARPIKGSWAVEGGGALISQAIHQVDVLLHLIGAVEEVFGYWQLGATHKIESEDCVCAVMRYASGATGVIQAATALWPGYPERVEIHGTKGSAIVTGDQLTAWDVKDDAGESAPLAQLAKSGASDPMAISTVPFERQLAEFGDACKAGREPACSGVDGYKALELVRSIYDSCAEGRKVQIAPSVWE